MQATLQAVDLALADAGTSLTSGISGGMRHARTAAGAALAEVSSSIAAPSAQPMTFTDGGGPTARTSVIGPFATRSSVQPDGTASIGIPGDALVVSALGAAFTIEVTQPLRAAAGVAPASGGFRAAAQDGSTLTATVTDGAVLLEVDTNGDGIADGTLSVAWDALD